MARVRVLKVVYTPAVHRRGTTHDPVDFITLREQELRQVRAILPGDTCDQGDLSHGRGKSMALHSATEMDCNQTAHRRI